MRAQLVMAMADLHGEFMGKGHGTIRSMGDSQGALAQIGHGLDNKVCVSYKRSQVYCEYAVCYGLVCVTVCLDRSTPPTYSLSRLLPFPSLPTKQMSPMGTVLLFIKVWL